MFDLPHRVVSKNIGSFEAPDLIGSDLMPKGELSRLENATGSRVRIRKAIDPYSGVLQHRGPKVRQRRVFLGSHSMLPMA